MIGPISDVEHVSKIPGDAEEIMEELTEMKNVREEHFEAIYKKIIEADGNIDDIEFNEDEEFRRMLKKSSSSY